MQKSTTNEQEAFLRVDEVFTFRDDTVKEGWERTILLMSDIHLDNPHCRRDLVAKHLDEARALNAKVFSIGDLFCAMGGKFDPRRSKSDVRPENNNDRYLDSLVHNNYRFLQPWADLFWLITDGNHETSIRSHNETDLTARLAEKLGCHRGGYSGFVRFLFSQDNEGHRTQRRFYFHHGAGGGGEVTKNIGRANRQAVWVPDADILAGGHVHYSWDTPVVRVRCSDKGRVYLDEQIHIQLATYKDEFTLRGGYHLEGGRPPKPLGGYWLKFYYRPDRLGNVGIRVYRAD